MADCTQLGLDLTAALNAHLAAVAVANVAQAAANVANTNLQNAQMDLMQKMGAVMFIQQQMMQGGCV